MSSQISPFPVPVSFKELDHEPKNTWIDYGQPARRIIKKGWTKDEVRNVSSTLVNDHGFGARS